MVSVDLFNAIIYKTVNLINGKIYIGQHKRNKPHYLGSGVAFREALKKYGRENFKRETLEKLTQVSQQIIDEREKHWIEFYQSQDVLIGYNITEGGLTRRGKYRIRGTFIHSKESLEKIREAALKRRGKPSWNKGVKYTKEQTKNMHKPKTEEHKLKLRQKVVSQETKELLSRSHKGKPVLKARKPIKQLTLDGIIIQTFTGVSEAAKFLHLCASDISRCCKHINKTCGNFKFEYL